VLFAIMELGGSGAVLQTIQKLHLSGKLFSYGMTQSDSGFTLYKPGQPGALVPFAALVKQVPPPFNKEVTGGAGQVIHDKFIVLDFNGDNPIVFTGSSNLAEGGESQNGDNLLMISDPVVARIFAAEAVRLVDHYYFRAAMRTATTVKPLQLSQCGTAKQTWWQRDYDPTNMRNVQRLLFAMGPSAVTTIPGGVSDPSGAAASTAKKKAPAKKKAAKKKSAKKTTPKAKKAAKSKAKPAKTAKKKPAKAAKKKSTKPAKKKSTKTAKKKAPAKKKSTRGKKPARSAAKPKSTAAAKKGAKKSAGRSRRTRR